LLDDVAVVLELLLELMLESELDPEDELDDNEESPPDDEPVLPLAPELLPDEPLPGDEEDEEPLLALRVLEPALGLALVVVAPWDELLLPEELVELLLP
jgi:hypothetical protein